MKNLWAVNSLGKVYTLSPTSDQWVEVETDGLDLKKVASHEFFCWGICGDNQIYIYVPSRDIPIRSRVVSYENERWNPIHGFCSKLLPTDRPHFSSADGLQSLPKKDFKLPSNNWEWEEDWYVEDNLDGQPLEPEAWTYATDFPTTYRPSKSGTSFVRRRKWIRYRRYCATNRWALIPSINEDPILEPFIDVAIGGTEIPGGEPYNFAVWAVTIMGRVLFRYEVTHVIPEGSGWVPIKTPVENDISQISVGPTGLTWAISYTGYCLVRIGVTRENIMGSSWIKSEPPSDSDPLTQVCVGTNVVWALSKQHKVWFRKGINGLHSGENEEDATGSRWIEMVGLLTNISIGEDDQVFGISLDAQNILFRTGLSSSELFGRTWKKIETSVMRLSHSLSMSSLGSSSISSHKCSTSDSVSLSGSLQDAHRISRECYITDLFKSSAELGSSSPLQLTSHLPVEDETQVADDSLWNGMESVNLDVDAERSLMWESPLEAGENGFSQIVMWKWISAGGCWVNPEALESIWFHEGNSKSQNVINEPWYPDIWSQFKTRYNREVSEFVSYPKAVEKSSWVKTVVCRWFKHTWIKCILELMQHGDNSNKDTLTWHYEKDQVSIQVKHISCAMCLSDWGKNILVVHTSKKTTPYRFAFTSNDDLEEWLTTLNRACRDVHNLPWVPEKTSIWSLTVNGGIFVHNASCEKETEFLVNMKWVLLGGGHLRLIETCAAGISWGLGYNCTAWVYTRGYGGGPYHGAPGCSSAIGPMFDTRCLYIYENQRWNPLSGFTDKGLPTDRYMWSDETGKIETTKDNTHLPPGPWQWTTDWTIDYKTSGGVDNEGWQYATDFPRSYHGYKRITDYVRRRRWSRKCKLSITGPFKQLNTSPLLDISLQIDPCIENEPISVWAVAINGDVLFRNGVTENCPVGSNWSHVPSEKPFCSISVGGGGVVWGIAQDGSAQLRHGISNMMPTGQYWCHIEGPQNGCHLKQISAGKTVVLAVDENCKLWSREEIVPIFKEGTHWKLICENVKQVSVGPADQIWCIANKIATPSGELFGVVCRRTGITTENPYGTDWEHGIGGGWSYLSVRGCLFDN